MTKSIQYDQITINFHRNGKIRKVDLLKDGKKWAIIDVHFDGGADYRINEGGLPTSIPEVDTDVFKIAEEITQRFISVLEGKGTKCRSQANVVTYRNGNLTLELTDYRNDGIPDVVIIEGQSKYGPASTHTYPIANLTSATRLFRSAPKRRSRKK